jgi:acetylornithine deacetylase/succinyl-diaminopimelate desuccinylase-like protein
VLLYGHLDKQPEFSGWRKDLGPVDAQVRGRPALRPRRRRRRLRGLRRHHRLEALQAQGLPHPRCVGLIETCEESGSPDLPAYIDALQAAAGQRGLVVCLDSGAGNYDQLWLTTSLRGMVSGVLKVEILTEGIHSGDARAWCRRSFRILRQVLDRLEDSKPPAACCPRASTARSPAVRALAQAQATARS